MDERTSPLLLSTFGLHRFFFNRQVLIGVEIRWPSGKVDKLTNLPINTYLKVIEGEGVAKNNLTAAK